MKSSHSPVVSKIDNRLEQYTSAAQVGTSLISDTHFYFYFYAVFISILSVYLFIYCYILYIGVGNESFQRAT